MLGAFLMASCFLASPSVTLAQASVPLGLWGAEVEFGPKLRGPLRIEPGADGSFTASVEGLSAKGEMQDGRFVFEFPDGQGTLVGDPPQVGRQLHAYWIQPRNNLGRFASPVPLSILWSPGPVLLGEVRPVIDRISLYLYLSETDSGWPRGVFHNPEMGWTGQRRQFRVRVAGENLELLDVASGAVRFQQPYDPARQSITMDFGSPFELKPMSPTAARGFLPRVDTAYTYGAPAADDDGWRSARARSAGFDEVKLAALVRKIIATDVRAGEGPRIHSLLVARKGKLVLEEYFHGFTRDEPHDIRSAGKSFTSLMTGIAIDRGYFTIDTPLYPILGQAPDADPRRARITVGHALSHSTGFACNDDDENSPGQEDRMYRQVEQPDWYRYALVLPMANDPGSTWSYCTAGINLAGAMIATTGKVRLLDFFDQRVATPLQMKSWAMNLMPNGDAFAGGGAYLRPRDLLKLGQVYVNGGTWNGERIVSRRWVELSTTKQMDVPDGTSDGYGWHLKSLPAKGREWPVYYASGNGGQLVVVVPELDLVVGFTAGNYMRYPIWRDFRDVLVPEVIEAIR